MARHRWSGSGRHIRFRCPLSASWEPTSTSSAYKIRRDCRTTHGTWTTSGSNRNRHRSENRSIINGPAIRFAKGDEWQVFFMAGHYEAAFVKQRVLVLGSEQFVAARVMEALSASDWAT